MLKEVKTTFIYYSWRREVSWSTFVNLNISAVNMAQNGTKKSLLEYELKYLKICEDLEIE